MGLVYTLFLYLAYSITVLDLATSGSLHRDRENMTPNPPPGVVGFTCNQIGSRTDAIIYGKKPLHLLNEITLSMDLNKLHEWDILTPRVSPINYILYDTLATCHPPMSYILPTCTTGFSPVRAR